MKTYYPEKPMLITLEQPLFKELELREDVVCEPKYNDTHIILKRISSAAISGSMENMEWVRGSLYEFWNRSGEMLKYAPSNELLDQLDQIKWEGDCVLDGLLMHFKTKKIKNTVILLDVIVWNSELLINKLRGERRALLEEKSIALTDYYFLDGRPGTGKVYLAPQWKGGVAGQFYNLYKGLTAIDEIEGIVIKSKNAKYKLGRTESPTVSTMWKVRKPGPSYRGGENWRHDND